MINFKNYDGQLKKGCDFVGDIIDLYRQKGLNDYQLNEIKEGFKNGLSKEQVDIYAKEEFNFMQMQELRLGLQHGLNEKEMAVFLSKDVDYKAMQHARMQIEDLNAINERRSVELIRKKVNIGVKIIVSVCVIAATGIIGFVSKDYIKAYFDPLSLDLKNDEVSINYGDPFVASDYIRSYTDGEGTQLILPDSITTTSIGVQKVTYILKNKAKSIKKTMTVNVVDLESPVIVLNAKETTLTRGKETFSCQAYLSNATDNVDGDLTDRVQCSQVDENKDEQIVTFSVTDSSDNSGTTDLKLIFVDPEPEPDPIVIVREPEIPVIQPQQPADNTPVQQQPSAPPQQMIPQKHGEQYFMFEDGYDFDTAYEACVAQGSTKGSYTCMPILGDDIYTGYKLSY